MGRPQGNKGNSDGDLLAVAHGAQRTGKRGSVAWSGETIINGEQTEGALQVGGKRNIGNANVVVGDRAAKYKGHADGGHRCLRAAVRRSESGDGKVEAAHVLHHRG